MPSREDAFAAVTAGDVEALRAVLREAPALAGARREDGLSLFMLACYHQRPEVLDVLQSAGISLDIFEAAAAGDLGRLSELLDAEPSLVGAYSADGWTALHLASFFGRLDCVEALIQRGAAVHRRSRKPLENTPLNAAAAGNHLEVCRALLGVGADPNARQSGGFVPLHAAAQNGNRQLVELLLDRGAERTVLTDDGRTAGRIAADAGWQALSEVLE